ncbi:actin-binding, cofilin/tropomyosin type protein [Tanacetum coccineum]
MFIKSRFYLDDEYVDMIRNKFLQYTRLTIPEFRDTLIQHMESVKKSIGERAQHKMEYERRVNERQIQTTEEKTDTSNALDALDASSVIIESNGTESKEQDTSSRSGNDAHVDDADIRPIYNEEPMAEVQTTAEINIFATGQQHTEQPEFINEGEVDQNAEQCHDICPLPAKLTDDRTTELSNQLLESENVCLKTTVAQCQKDFAKLEAHCIDLELQMQNNVLKSGQQSQFLKEKSNEAKVKNDIDVTETINIELEHSVAKLLAENEQLHKEKEHLKQTYKDLFDSIKRTRVQTKNQNDSLMEQLNKKSNENADVLAQIQKKGFAIAALKNELRKLTGNSVNTKFAKPSILGKPVGQPLKNQSVVRQPTAFKSERPKISKPRFASQVDVNNDLSKPVTTHHFPKRRESAPAKPHNMIAPSSSRLSRTVSPLMGSIQKDFSSSSTERYSLKYSSSSLGRQCQMMSDHNSSDLAPQRQEMSVENVSSGLVPQGQKASDYDNSDPVPPRQNVVPSAEKTVSSHQGLEFLFSPLLEEYYNPTHGLAEENNNDQAPNASFQEAEFVNPFCTRVQEIGESSSRNIDNTDVHSFQPQSHDFRWTADNPLEQVHGNLSKPVQTRRQLAQILKCVAMQDELHQFDRLKVWELVDKPFGKMIIKLKWLWKNKKDEDQTVIRNKARLVAKGYAQEEGIDFEESFAPLSLGSSSDFRCPRSTQVFSNLSDGRQNGIS